MLNLAHLNAVYVGTTPTIHANRCATGSVMKSPHLCRHFSILTDCVPTKIPCAAPEATLSSCVPDKSLGVVMQFINKERGDAYQAILAFVRLFFFVSET